jgi:hypothetical protein
MALIVNCDLKLGLRIAGHEKNHIDIDTDEGDGVTILCRWNRLPDYYKAPEVHHYEEWAAQLDYIAEELRNRAHKIDIEAKHGT